MNKTAVEGARSCLDRAKAAVTAMEYADSFDKMEDAWTDFLVMGNRVYTRLEQGSKTDGKSVAWFGRKKHERRKDPLLRYIKNARDADEHGLEKVTERQPGSIGVKLGGGEPVHVEEGHIISGPSGVDMSFKLRDSAAPVSISVNPASVRLVEVTNYGDKYQPPGSTNPIAVAQKAVTFLEALIAEAENLTP
jgi:hypothetical protein